MRGSTAIADRPPEAMLALLPNWLGDAVMATPALRALRKRFPEARLTLAGRTSVCGLLEGLPWVDSIVPLPTRPGPLALIRTGRQLRRGAPDLCVAFPHSFRAALLARLSGARRRLGYARDGRSFLLTDAPLPTQKDGERIVIYTAQEYLDLAAVLGAEDDGAGLELHAAPEAVAAVRERLGGGPVVAIAPGAAFGPSKCWPADRYAAVADALAEQADARCVLITGPGEEETRDAVVAAAETAFFTAYEGRPTLADLKATIAASDMLVGNDSGPRHVAIAFKKPVICIMGPTSPRYTDGPWERGEVIRVDVDCGPCQKPTCATDHRCMAQILPERVIAAALEHLPH